jgi:hypothetical protein
MRVFHVIAFEGFVASGQPAVSSPSLSELFGSVERLYVSGYATQVSGTDPELTIQEQISLDGENWDNGGGWFQIGPVPKSIAGQETPFQGVDADPDLFRFGAKPPFRRLLITVSNLGGGNANAMIRMWATGRDRSRRARALAFTG